MQEVGTASEMPWPGEGGAGAEVISLAALAKFNMTSQVREVIMEKMWKPSQELG